MCSRRPRPNRTGPRAAKAQRESLARRPRHRHNCRQTAEPSTRPARGTSPGIPRRPPRRPPRFIPRGLTPRSCLAVFMPKYVNSHHPILPCGQQCQSTDTLLKVNCIDDRTLDNHFGACNTTDFHFHPRRGARIMPDQSLLLLLDEVRGKTLRLLHAVTDQEAHWPPPELHNHILWHAGHSFVLVESLAMEAVGDLPADPGRVVRDLQLGEQARPGCLVSLAAAGEDCRPIDRAACPLAAGDRRAKRGAIISPFAGKRQSHGPLCHRSCVARRSLPLGRNLAVAQTDPHFGDGKKP